ncbi:MAG: hypothetical protein L3J28_07295 [Candidatus Polarisedimenticolaceae bacterium]|nr:hypothetical protein [Candidatus Polarisedimenticolaceae bacterium]
MSSKFKCAGFALTNTATALVVSGVLLGGAVQGKQMVANSDYEHFKQQISSYQSAVERFEARYKALPGDYASASTELTAPAGVTIQNGNGNGAVMGGFCNVANEEACIVWQHLILAGLIEGDVRATDTTARQRHIYGGVVSSMATGDYANGKGELKMLLEGVPADVAQRLDDEMDDGNATSGNIARYGGTGSAYDSEAALNLCITL